MLENSRQFWTSCSVCAELVHLAVARWQFTQQRVNAHVNVRTHLKITRRRFMRQIRARQRVSDVQVFAWSVNDLEVKLCESDERMSMH